MLPRFSNCKHVPPAMNFMLIDKLNARDPAAFSAGRTNGAHLHFEATDLTSMMMLLDEPHHRLADSIDMGRQWFAPPTRIIQRDTVHTRHRSRVCITQFHGGILQCWERSTQNVTLNKNFVQLRLAAATETTRASWPRTPWTVHRCGCIRNQLLSPAHRKRHTNQSFD